MAYSHLFQLMIQSVPLMVALCFLAGFVICWLLVPMIRKLAISVDIVDQRQDNSAEPRLVPRGGGVAIALAIFVASWFGYFIVPGFKESIWFNYAIVFTVAKVMVVLLGLVDDVFGLKRWVKIIFEALIAVYFIQHDVYLTISGVAWTQLPLFYYPATILWIVGMMNAFELIDGLDGLATGLASISCLGMVGALLVSGCSLVVVTPYIIGASALLAFLQFNKYPASISLGSIGSLYIGQTLAAVPLVTQSQGVVTLSLLIPVLCAGIPLLETLLTLIRRSIEAWKQSLLGQKTIPEAIDDTEHIDLRVMRHFEGNPRKAVYFLYLLAMIFVCGGILGAFYHNSLLAVFLIAFSIISYVYIKYLNNTELWDVGQISNYFEVHSLSRRFTTPLGLIWDISWILGLITWGLFLTKTSLNAPFVAPMLLIPTTIILGLLACTKAYSLVWNRVSAYEQVKVVTTIQVGTLFAGIVLYMMDLGLAPKHYYMLVGVAFVSPVAIVSIRLVRIAFVQFALTLSNRNLIQRSESDAGITRTIIYGGGRHLNAYLMAKAFDFDIKNECLIGIIDDDKNLCGSTIKGLRVIGNYVHFMEHYDDYRATRIIVTLPSLEGKRYQSLYAFAKSHNIEIVSFRMSEQSVHVVKERHISKDY